MCNSIAGANAPDKRNSNASDAEWPEFRRWYELTMEEQRIYDEEPDEAHDHLLDALERERVPLEQAMLSRKATTLAHFAMLAVIELRFMEKHNNPLADEADHGLLDLMAIEDGEHRFQGVVLVRALIKAAREQGLLGGIVIHGEERV